MAISKTKNYLVLNYGSSPVSVSTKYENYMIPGAENGDPATLPLTMDEIQVINSNSPVFKTGVLRFEKEYEGDIYAELRIGNWQDIMTNDEIEYVLLNPTADTLQKLISIESEFYFERIRGIYMGLKNSGRDISLKVSNAIEARRKEFVNHRHKTEIQIIPTQQEKNSSAEVNELKNQLAEMREMMSKMIQPVEEVTDDSKKEDTENTTKTSSRKGKKVEITK